MTKSAKKPTTRSFRNVSSSKIKQSRSRALKSSRSASGHAPQIATQNANSKQSRVIAMLQAPEGTSIAAMMRTTGWQQHSVRGFLAGVVRKKLKLKLVSDMTGDERIYRIAVAGAGKASGSSLNPPSA